jgi:hypothetical protein
VNCLRYHPVNCEAPGSTKTAISLQSTLLSAYQLGLSSRGFVVTLGEEPMDPYINPQLGSPSSLI